MEEIVHQFMVLAEREDFTPVIVFLPESGELAGYDDGDPPRYAKFKKKLQESYASADLIMADVYEEELEVGPFMTRAGCHPSEYGNKIIARAVHRAIADRVAQLKAK